MTATVRPTRRFAGRPTGTEPGGSLPPPGVEVQAQRPAIGTGRVHAGRLWLVQALTGAALIGFLGLHLFAQHFLAPGGLRNFEAVVDYLRQPLAIVAEMGLVLTVVAHAAIGTRGFLVEALPGPRAVRLATIAITVVSIGIVAYTGWLTALLASWPLAGT